MWVHVWIKVLVYKRIQSLWSRVILLVLILSLFTFVFEQEEGHAKAEDEDGPPEEDLYEKAEKDFWDIINTEKKKQPDPSQDFEKADTGKVYM